MSTNWTSKNRYDALLNNDHDHYLVGYEDGTTEVKHSSTLSNILQCGEPAENYGIARLQQCWAGEEIGIEGEV